MGTIRYVFNGDYNDADSELATYGRPGQPNQPSIYDPNQSATVSPTGFGQNFTLSVGGDSQIITNNVGSAGLQSNVNSINVDYSDNVFGVNLTGGALGDVLRGGAGFGTNDILNGGGGNDVLEGGFGVNTIDGGDGINTASYENFVPLGDDSGNPPPSTATGVTVNLANNVATYVAPPGILLLSDTLSNIQNVLGSAYADTITGDANANTLAGGAGKDYLDGGAGDDTLIGGSGNDAYILRVGDENDTIVELAGQGIDTVRAAFSITLGNNIERLQLVGKADLDGTGNALKNTLIGNTAGNVLDGKEGSDVLTGFGGSDTFVFSTALGPTNIDRITDFDPADDTIALLASIFDVRAGVDGTLDPTQFAVLSAQDVAEGVKYGAEDRIIYREDKGALYYDADGYGGERAVAFAVFDRGVDGSFPTISADDFSILPSR